MNRARNPAGSSAEWPLIVVSAGAAVGLLLLVIGVGGFRPGATVIGLSIGLAALLRAALSEERAGLLAVRARGTDVVLLASLGIAIVVLATVVPPAT